MRVDILNLAPNITMIWLLSIDLNAELFNKTENIQGVPTDIGWDCRLTAYMKCIDESQFKEYRNLFVFHD